MKRKKFVFKRKYLCIVIDWNYPTEFVKILYFAFFISSNIIIGFEYPTTVYFKLFKEFTNVLFYDKNSILIKYTVWMICIVYKPIILPKYEPPKNWTKAKIDKNMHKMSIIFIVFNANEVSNVKGAFIPLSW